MTRDTEATSFKELKEKKKTANLIFYTQQKHPSITKAKEGSFFRHAKSKRSQRQQTHIKRNVKGIPVSGRKLTPDGNLHKKGIAQEMVTMWVNMKKKYIVLKAPLKLLIFNIH